jgi:hypothetical protein
MRRVVGSVSVPLAWPLRFGILTALLGVGAHAHATDFWWDGTSVYGGSRVPTLQGGKGNWDTTLTNWDIAATGDADFAWVNGGNRANFGGITYDVTQGMPITISDIGFASGAANVGLNGATLSLVGEPLIDIVSNGNYVTGNSASAGTSGLTKSGAGA